jgi:hypothetical protein
MDKVDSKNQENFQIALPELSPKASDAINFILSYQPYECYDAAPRIKAVLLRDGVIENDCIILTTRLSRHYWVQMGDEKFSTADMSNFRDSPSTDRKTKELEEIAKKHAESDSEKEFDVWVYDKNGDLLKEHQQLKSLTQTYS